METVELIVYIVISIILAGIIIGFIVGFDFLGLHKDVVRLFRDDPNLGFERVSNETFMGKMTNIQKACERTDRELNTTIYLKEGDMTKEMFFKNIQALNLCGSFQSVQESCGEGEYFDRFDVLSEGDVVLIRCRGPKIFDVSVVGP